MTDSQTPEWLINTQNKSWEPEILISGITLTFLFIISNHIYNFFAMLVQDFAVWEAISRTLYRISILLLNGLKIILIIHLLLRGVWTGFVGLSYVFPDGVNREKLSRTSRDIHYDNPVTFVIRIEKVCSLLFSFIFSTLTFVIGFLVVFAPMIVLFLVGLHIKWITIIAQYIIIPMGIVGGVLMIVFEKKFKNSRIGKKLENSFFQNILAVYYTNIGKFRTTIILILYFLILTLISWPQLNEFDFKNNRSREINKSSGMVSIENNLYQDLRDGSRRVAKAVLNKFQISGQTIELFISRYKEDHFTIEMIKENPELLNKIEEKWQTPIARIPDLFKIRLNGDPVTGLEWYRFADPRTGQQGLKTDIIIESLDQGFHKLSINKLYGNYYKKKLSYIKDWEVIQFKIKSR